MKNLKNVCMYVCMCVCMYARVYVCMYVCMYGMYVINYVCVCVYVYVCIHVYVMRGYRGFFWVIGNPPTAVCNFVLLVDLPRTLQQFGSAPEIPVRTPPPF